MPNNWLMLIASVFIFQSIVLIGALKLLEFEDVSKIWKKSILWNTFYGFLAYIIAAALFSCTLMIKEGSGINNWLITNITSPLTLNPFSNIFALLYAAIVIAITGLLLYVANRGISFRKTELNELGAKKVSFYLALFTAPYIVLIPSDSFYNSVVGMIHSIF